MNRPVKRIVLLGGYGNFGKRIAESLARVSGITLMICGRNPARAEKLCTQLRQQGAQAVLQPVILDITSPVLHQKLKRLEPELIIHTSGPFQGQDYRIAESCVELGCNYIDLADDRRFVCDIRTLDEAAKKNGVSIISGASSVPGLSSAVVDQLAEGLMAVEAIDFAIAPGNKAERGKATVEGILSYTGHPFRALQDGEWIDSFGWMSPRRLDFGGTIGKRWLANVDIPDLELFPERYPEAATVRFQAGLELSFLHLTMVAMAWLARIGLVRNWQDMTDVVFQLGEHFRRFGSDAGAMRVEVTGKNEAGELRVRRWTLIAENGVGPYIPTLSAIILAQKLIRGEDMPKGAQPCTGLYTLAEFDQLAESWGIYHNTEELAGS